VKNKEIQMPHFRYAVQVPLSLERTFALYTDANRLTDWFPNATAVEHLTAPMSQPGSRFTIRFKGLPDANEEVLEVEPNRLQRRKFVQAQGGIGVWGDVRIHFRSVEGQTEVQEEVEYGFQPALLAPLLHVLSNARARTAMRRELEGFRMLAEREANGSTGHASG
jgi:uncharacterized protein YndB with AHSA1/START domain